MTQRDPTPPWVFHRPTTDQDVPERRHYPLVQLKDYDNLLALFYKQKNEYIVLDQNLNRIKAERDNLQAQIRNSSCNSSEISTLKLELDRLKRNISQLEDEKQQLNRKNAILEEKYIRSMSNSQFLNNVSTMDKLEITRQIREGIEKIEEEKNKITALYNICEAKVKEMQSSIVEMEQTIIELKKTNHVLKEKLEKCETGDKDDIIEKLLKQVKTLNDKLREYEKNDKDEEIEKLLKQVKTLESKNKSLTIQLNSKKKTPKSKKKSKTGGRIKRRSKYSHRL